MTLTEPSSAQHAPSGDELPLTWGKLIGRNFLSASAALYLESAVRARQTILVSGPPGSGRTTLLNVLGAAMGYSTGRVIVVEREFKLSFPHLLADAPSLRTSPLARHQTERLLHQVPHHRPERFVVDDLVDEFAWNVWESIVSRCPGSVLSISAASGLEALRQFAELSGGGARILAPMLAASVAVVVQLMRVGGTPAIVEVIEVEPEYGGDFAGHVLFTRDPERNRLHWRKFLPGRIVVPTYPDWELR